MTNPHSQADPTPSVPLAANAPGTPSGKSPRKGPRRATAPAGAPATTASLAPAVLVIGADGMIVSPHSETPPALEDPTPEVADLEAPSPEDSSSAISVDDIPVAEPTTAETDDAGDSPTADTEPEAPEPDVELEPQDHAKQDADEAAPTSRRERRLAEQKLDSDPKPSARAPGTQTPRTETPNIPMAIVSEPKGNPEAGRAPRADKQGGKRDAKQKKRPLAFLKALLFMIVIAAVVVGMGTVLSGKEDASLGQSQTELNRQAAWEKTTTLLEQATTLAGSSSNTKVQDLLNQTAKDLAIQAAALSDGLPPNTSNTTSPAAASPVSVGAFVLALNASGEELLNNALSAEQAMGRVFAATGTSRILQAQSLTSATGSAPISSNFLPARVNFPAPKAPDCKSALEPRPGVTIDSALGAAALGEQKAIYAYQVATTRMSEPRFSQSATLLARHEAKLKVLNEELRVRCLPLATAVAGFTLDSSFTTSPAPALAGLESELAGLYADLAALSTAPLAAAAGTAAPQATADVATASSITGLREISVTWLLDSTESQLLWGGSLNALSGMPDA